MPLTDNPKHTAMKSTIKITLVLISAIWISSAQAADCKAEKPAAELTIEDLQGLYECLRPSMIKGYQKKGHEIANAYTNWQSASIAPQAPGMHSGQYLMTYVNPTGYDQYVQFNTDGTAMPTGTVIAKEAFSISKKGKIKIGPLLFMEKVGLDAAPETGGWKYTGIKSNGKKLKVKDKDFCHACHLAWPGQDFQGYPVPAVRATSG